MFESQPVEPQGNHVSQRVNPKIAMAEEAARQQAIIEAERQARLAELHRLERLPFGELTPAQCIIVHGSDYPLCPGAAPVADLFPEHGDGVPALYSEPTLPLHDPGPWGQRVEDIIEASQPLPQPEVTGLHPRPPGMSATGGVPGEGAGLGLATLAVLFL